MNPMLPDEIVLSTMNLLDERLSQQLDQKGIFAFVRKDEPRDKEVRMPRQDLLIR